MVTLNAAMGWRMSTRTKILASATSLVVPFSIVALASVSPADAVISPRPAVLTASATVSLRSLGAPKATARCVGAAYRVASAKQPIYVNGGRRFTSGFELTGASCDTTFTWRLAGRYTRFTADVYLNQADSGPLPLVFKSGSAVIAFSANAKTVKSATVKTSVVRVQVTVSGVQNFSIVMPNGGNDAGLLDFTADLLTKAPGK
jgi:hypothetical protein